MKKIKPKATKEWVPIKKIYNNGVIEIENNKFIKIMQIIPINYNLKSELEKKSILNSYKIFLKTCNFNIQIVIHSSKEDLNQHILKIQNNIQKKENQYLKDLSENYISYIKKINISKKSSTKEFYLIISNDKNQNRKENINYEIIHNDLQEKYFKIKECLARCGNSVLEIENKEKVLNIFNEFLNNRKNI